MPSDVRVEITDVAIISALNTPGQPVARWRDETGVLIANRARERSPKNAVANARHRGGVTGTFRAGWHVAKRGNQHRLTAIVSNVAPHAVYVEFGRSASTKLQRFSWTKWGGRIRTVGTRPNGKRYRAGKGTAERRGKHVLRNATNYVMPGRTGGTYTPLA